MFWPFGKGSVDIQLDKYDFSPGDTVSGKAVFTLKKVVHARGAKVRLIGVKKETKIGGSALFNSKTNVNKSMGYVFDFVQPLSGEKDYSGNFTYNFKIKIPKNVLTQSDIGEGIAGTIIKSAQILSGVSSQIKWYVVAFLDVPMGIDVSKKVQINVG
ncbi:hypothetical protein FJZ19_01860 [Candidatus Pacearchaeota archaeon]|nr:hypothetical protein [Candidatus Pacearchaeota archaeon]